MTALLGMLKGIKLSVTEWLLISMATLIGGLVVALRLQGSRLHKAQVDVLQSHVQAQDSQDDAAVAAANRRFLPAYTSYLNAHKGPK